MNVSNLKLPSNPGVNTRNIESGADASMKLDPYDTVNAPGKSDEVQPPSRASPMNEKRGEKVRPYSLPKKDFAPVDVSLSVSSSK